MLLTWNFGNGATVLHNVTEAGHSTPGPQASNSQTLFPAVGVWGGWARADLFSKVSFMDSQIKMSSIKQQSNWDDALTTPWSRSYGNERAGALGRAARTKSKEGIDAVFPEGGRRERGRDS